MKSLRPSAALLALIPLGAFGQNLCPNPSAESGTVTPSAWFATPGGLWDVAARTGSRSLSIVGDSNSFRYWVCSPPVQQGKAYVVRYYATSTNNSSGFISGGFTTAKKDQWTRPPTVWADYSHVTWIPSNGAPELRLECYYGNGTVGFDDIQVLPLNPVHRVVGPYVLSAGEKLEAGRYTFASDYGGYGANYSRPLHQGNASFNTTRWYMNSNSSVLYRHELNGQPFSNAQITCGIHNYNNVASTTLWVQASIDASHWQFVGSLQGTNIATFPIPTGLLPAPELYVRLSSAASVQFGLTNYIFSADVPDGGISGSGSTHYFGQLLTNEAVRIVSAEVIPEGKLVTVAIANGTASSQAFELVGEARYAGTTRERSISVVISAGETNQASVVLPTAGFGENTALVTVRNGGGTNIFQQNLTFTVSILADDSYGELLPSPTNAPVWWCEGPHKVGQSRGLPLATNTHASLSAARNEYEPFQIVLRPEQTLSNVTASVGDFQLLSNASMRIASSNVTSCLVDYVPVTQLMSVEAYSTTGTHPDPLLPLSAPFTAPARTNSPLWFTLYVPKDAPAGWYEATINLSWDSGVASVPVRLKVYDFALSDVTHTPNAYNVYVQNSWHGLASATEQQKAQVWELYLQNMARHRATPYFPQFFSPLAYAYNSGTGTFTYDFAAFDSAMECYLEEYHFTTFKDITIERQLPPIAGIPYFTATTNAINPAYRALYPKLMQPVIQHFRERGWFDKAYTLWIDEPQDWKLPMVQDGMKMVEDTAPDTARLFSKQNGPAAAFGGSVWAVLWEGLNLSAAAERVAAGDKLWCYMGTRPPAPWPNSFVDHPAINPRVRSWFVEKLNLDGEIYWAINYYSSTNPWLYPMCIISGSTPYLLGNGDGVFVYPPTKEYSQAPLISGPFDSIRWEMNREGMEDREYFWLLKRAIAAAEPLLGTNHPVILEGKAAYAEAMQVAVWPPAYPYEPGRVKQVRERIAQAIEGLDDGSPFVAKEPLSKVVKVGDAERLRVEVVGWPVPTIQWQHQGTNLPGGTGAKLSLTNITPEMAGDYRVIAYNSSGSVTSAVGRLTVLITNQPPVVIKHPDSLSRTNGQRAVFGVGVSSLTPLTYQWLRDGEPISGATNVTLVVTNVDFLSTGSYAVVASNGFGAVTSAAAELTLKAPAGSMPPQITGQPTNLTVATGQNAQFTVTATGTAPLTYQWSVNGTNLSSGGTSNVLWLSNVQLEHSGFYRVVVGNVAGVVTSEVATLTVQVAPPAISSQPTNLIVVQGQSAQFSVVATGTGPLGYQWFFNETNLLSGANASSLLMSNVQPPQAGSYLVLITNTVGAVTSAPAYLQLAGMPNYTNEPPGLALEMQGSALLLLLPPDNRPRTILVSSNLVEWESYYAVPPSAAVESVSLATTNSSGRFFRVLITP